MNILLRSRKGAWIEMVRITLSPLPPNSRSRKGAWIEIKAGLQALLRDRVAPVRERGLK